MSPQRTRQVSLAAILAAIYFVLRSIPTFQMVGVAGRFTAADFLLTTIALIAGGWGAISVIIGTVLSYSITPPVFFGLDFLPAVSNILVVSLILSKRLNTSRFIYSVILLTFLMSPYSLTFGYGAIPYAWLHVFALVVLLSPLPHYASVWLRNGGRKQVLAILVLGLTGTMIQHLVGGLLYELTAGIIGGITPDAFHRFWQVIFWVYPIERCLIVASSTLIAVVAERSLRQTRMCP